SLAPLSLILHPLLSSTLFPYTTLFRSDYDVYLGIENCPMLFSQDEWPSGKNLAYSPRTWRRMFEAIPSPHLGLNYDPSHLVWQIDRKSTRLNSSHEWISYAVFCLKKKK